MPWERTSEEILQRRHDGWLPSDFPLDAGQMAAHKAHGGKWDAERIAKAVNLAQRGLSQTGIAGQMGVTIVQWLDYLRLGRAPEARDPWKTLAMSVQFAQGLLEERALESWVEAFDKDWRASKEFLASRIPQEYGTAQRLEITGGVQHNVVHTLEDSDLIAVAQLLQTIGAGPKDMIEGEVIEDGDSPG